MRIPTPKDGSDQTYADVEVTTSGWPPMVAEASLHKELTELAERFAERGLIVRSVNFDWSAHQLVDGRVWTLDYTEARTTGK